MNEILKQRLMNMYNQLNKSMKEVKLKNDKLKNNK